MVLPAYMLVLIFFSCLAILCKKYKSFLLCASNSLGSTRAVYFPKSDKESTGKEFIDVPLQFTACKKHLLHVHRLKCLRNYLELLVSSWYP